MAREIEYWAHDNEGPEIQALTSMLGSKVHSTFKDSNFLQSSIKINLIDVILFIHLVPRDGNMLLLFCFMR